MAITNPVVEPATVATGPDGAPAAPAAASWQTCSVTMAGPAENGVIYIHLQEAGGAFNEWFQATPAMKTEMLAVALSAIRAGRQVRAHVSDTTAYSTINRLYLA